MNQDWNVIFSYTRKQAIEDGVLIDVTDQAKQMGFKVNTVVTDHLYGDYLTPPAGLEGEGQSFEGRLTDLLFKTLIAAKTFGGGSRIEFDVLFLMSPGKWATVKILAVMGPGDHGEPVLTIMLPKGGPYRDQAESKQNEDSSGSKTNYLLRITDKIQSLPQGKEPRDQINRKGPSGPFLVGTLKGVGRVYLQSVIDCHSRYAWGRLYNGMAEAVREDLQARSVCP